MILHITRSSFDRVTVTAEQEGETLVLTGEELYWVLDRVKEAILDSRRKATWRKKPKTSSR